VVVFEFHIRRTGVGPKEGDSPLAINAYGEASGSLWAMKFVGGWNVEILDFFGEVKIAKTFKGLSLYIVIYSPVGYSLPNLFCGFIGKALDHHRSKKHITPLT